VNLRLCDNDKYKEVLLDRVFETLELYLKSSNSEEAFDRGEGCRTALRTLQLYFAALRSMDEF